MPEENNTASEEVVDPTDAPMDAIDSVIAKFEAGEFAEEAPATEEEKTEAQSSTDESPTGEPVEVEPGSTDEPPVEDQPLRAKQLAAIARKEAELQEREAALKATTENVDLESYKEALRQDTYKELAKLGLEKNTDLATQIWYGELGEDPPTELKSKLQNQSVRNEIQSLKQELEQFKSQSQEAITTAALRVEADRIEEQIQRFVDAVPEDLRFVHKLAEDNSQEAFEALVQTTANIYKNQGKLPTPQEVAKLIDTEMQKDWERFSSIQPKSEDTPTNTEETPTISTKEKGEKPKREKTDYSSFTDDDWEARGLQILKEHMK